MLVLYLTLFDTAIRIPLFVVVVLPFWIPTTVSEANPCLTPFLGKDEVLKFRDGLYASQSSTAKKRKREWVRPGVIHTPEIVV